MLLRQVRTEVANMKLKKDKEEEAQEKEVNLEENKNGYSQSYFWKEMN